MKRKQLLLTIGLSAGIVVIVILLLMLRNQQFDFIYQKF